MLDEPVDLPVNQPLEFELKTEGFSCSCAPDAEPKRGRTPDQEAAWQILLSRRIPGLNLPRAENTSDDIQCRLDALAKLEASAVKGARISDEALRRENMYEPPRGL